MVEQQMLTQTQNTQVAKQPKGWAEVLTEKLDGITEALPKDFSKSRFIQNSVALLTDNPDLVRKYKGDMVLAGLVKGAVLGVDFLNKECYLVPYGDRLQFQLDYKGAKKIARKYSIRPIKSIHAEVVREGDDFSTEIIDNKVQVNFKPKPFNNGKIVGAFAYIQYDDGDVIVDTMSLADLENTRSKSKMGKSGAWKDFTSEMYKKTVIRRLMKQVEIDFENPNQRTIYDDDEAIATEPQDIIDVTQAEISENANQIPFSIDGD